MIIRTRKINLNIVVVFIVILLFGVVLLQQVLADDIEISAEDRGVRTTGTIGENGAPWTLYTNGVIEVGGGTIFNPEAFTTREGLMSPWYGLRDSVTTIVFTEPVVASAHLRGFFAGLHRLVTIENATYIDTSQTTSMIRMFSGATALEEVDVSNWDTSNVTTMKGMFSGATALEEIDVSNWDTSNVIIMNSMFSGTSALNELNVSNWNTGNVNNMNSMFTRTGLNSLDLSSWDVSNVTNMSFMFGGVDLNSLDLSSWDVSNVTNMSNMFGGAEMLSTLTIGEDFVFHENSLLPELRQTDDYTGYWQNIGTGTQAEPNGEHVLTSAELMEQFDGTTMADTFVWQRYLSPLLVTYHVVQWGDTLSHLAIQYETTVDELVRLNNIEDPDFILTGQILTLP